MNIAIAPYSENVIKALTNQMVGDPKLAHEAVTGVCEWWGDVTYDIEQLYSRACEQIDDIEAILVNDWSPLTAPKLRTQLERLMAARDAFAELEMRARDRRSWNEDHGQVR